MYYLSSGLLIEQNEEYITLSCSDDVDIRLVLPSLLDRHALPRFPSLPFVCIRHPRLTPTTVSFPPLRSPIDRNLPAPILFHLDPISP